jgi:myb proto-oncogene protein|nr:putative Myb13 protein [Oryza sativa Japonica Group]BAD10752.1 putative Myb13 protein [Oryza sativa Japonica Group]BAG91649.1 unnamed protein product [Oryza sativa Japonica Group]
MGIDPATHQPLPNTKVVSQTRTSTLSTATTESAKSNGMAYPFDPEGGCSRDMSVPTDSMEQSSRNTSSHGLDPLVNWLLEAELPADEPWLNFTSSNEDDFSGIVKQSAWDGSTTDWLLDYQDFSMDDSSLIDGARVQNSDGLNF